MRTAIVSTYPPRACGIGTFAADVRAALLGVDGRRPRRERRDRQRAVPPAAAGPLATIAQAVRGDYVRAARILGRLDVDVVLLQHEYGIFGGRDGEYVLSLAEELSQPLVVTLHTVLSEPTAHQAEVLAGAVPAGGARDRDDGDGAAAARRRRGVPGREGSRRAARRADRLARARRVRVERLGESPRGRAPYERRTRSCSRRSG